ncbi:hypothetical protein IW261DRAFT_1568724 [Armillaria novae-zelandiae]|uniref:Uncharacterized protein n=1 Tax=Armillaria novae-zelandiae TaxID=153914 RepID=A0AA39NYR7_9AGAR|nr:hypothetical protein IW261DRAFT_1568724 [Armillaria novae-zelandiae]
MAAHYNLCGGHGMWNPASNHGSPPASLKSGESLPLNSPLTSISPSIVPAMPGAESTPLLYSRVVSPTIPPVETSSAPIDVASFKSSMGDHGSDDLLSSAQPSIGDNGSGDLPSGTRSPIEDGSDDRLAVFYDSFDEIAEEWDSNPNPWTHVVYGRHSSRSPTSSVLAQFSQQSIQSKSTVTRVRNECFPELGRGVGFQGTPIAVANTALTPEQQECICRWVETVDVASNGNESEDSADDKTNDEGPSSGKGKATDPCNWGAAHLSNEELDADEQRCAFRFWNWVKNEKAIELQALYDIQNNINAKLPASMIQEPVVEREMKQESFSVPILSLVVRRWPKVTIEDVVDDDESQYLG